ncbi:family 43 glycosylhydrolase [Niabella soli]|uniref:Glycosyl hydrolase family 43 n=1 Tax=Niabella soli DSM 19437 TaxID=929713 RepID=W0EWI6_9BACT|nr:family 43 glycosylhydrolase [Niabella soli]AHF15142.1 glycosyl hydrolase family 43 [Niabella soli DSM 19437]
MQKARNYYVISYKMLSLGFLVIYMCNAAKAQPLNIKNDVFWNTADGRPVYSQGGGIFKFIDPVTGKKKYYWYGAHYKEAAIYRQDPSVTLPGPTFLSVTCYSSVDLVNWTFEGDVLTRATLDSNMRTTWVGRLGVAYIPALKEYALFVQHGNQVLITVADAPNGPFSWYRRINMQAMIGTTNTGDQTVFTDEDTGKSYLIYSYGRGRNKIYVSEIGVKNGLIDLLDCTQVFKGASREGNCMFKYSGKYYMCASNIYGWDASDAYYMVADNIRGPYKPVDDMAVMEGCEQDYAHVTQTGFFVTVKGSKKETVVYCGDRWAEFAGNGLGYNQWFPLSFNKETPVFNSLSSWNLDAKTGEWTIGSNNNYVLNGSFEADRNHIPSHVKPVQTGLLGWHTVVTEGNIVSLDSSTSPVLNYFNTTADRKIVTGEKSLNITDKIPFKRKVYQLVGSRSKLPDGLYTLSAMTKGSNGFARLNMYADTGKKARRSDIQNENDTWKRIDIRHIAVTGGQVEIGFEADGAADAFCYVDDVSLTKE